jgi:hypothetical protein
MFEKEIKFIVDYTLNKLRKESAHLTIGRLLNSSIHPAVTKYVSAEISNLIKKDREKLLHESFFDYSGTEVTKYMNMIADEIKNNYKMKGEDLKKLIIKAVSFNINYVVRPGWTLAKFIYNEEKEKTLKEVLNYFSYVHYYNYQIEVLSAFIMKRKIQTLSQDEFVMITGRIDKEVISSNRKEILKDGVSSIADFFNEGGLSRDKVSPYLIELYLKDKKFTEAADIIKRAYAADDKQKQPVRDIVGRLAQALKEEIELPEKTDEPSSVEPPQEIKQEKTSPEQTSDVKIVPVSQESDDYQVTLKDLLKRSEEMKVSTKEFPVEANSTDSEEENDVKFTSLSSTPAEDISDSDDSDNNVSALKYYVREEKPEPEETTIQSIGMYNLHQKNDIFNFLSKKEIDRIVETVFNEDQNEFAASMDRLTDCRNYEEASGILKKVFQTYRVNPYSKDAVMLTTAVANYFNQG